MAGGGRNDSLPLETLIYDNASGADGGKNSTSLVHARIHDTYDRRNLSRLNGRDKVSVPRADTEVISARSKRDSQARTIYI